MMSLSQIMANLLDSKTKLIPLIALVRLLSSVGIQHVSIQYEEHPCFPARFAYRAWRQLFMPVSGRPPCPWLQTCDIANVSAPAMQYESQTSAKLSGAPNLTARGPSS